LVVSGQALGSGILNKERADFLGEVRDKMGLSKEAAEKIIKGVQNQHVISGLQVRLAVFSLHEVITMSLRCLLDPASHWTLCT
jgi:hypothetical protein